MAIHPALRVFPVMTLVALGFCAAASGDQHEPAVQTPRERFADLAAEYERGTRLFWWGDKASGAAALDQHLEHVECFLKLLPAERGRVRSVRSAHEAAMTLWQYHEAAGRLDEAVRFARLAATKHRRRRFCGNDDSPARMALQFADLLRRAGQFDEALAVCKPLLNYTSFNVENSFPSLALELTMRIELQRFSKSLELPAP